MQELKHVISKLTICIILCILFFIDTVNAHITGTFRFSGDYMMTLIAFGGIMYYLIHFIIMIKRQNFSKNQKNML